MTVTKQKNGKWVVDISDGFSPLTGKRIRHRKKGLKLEKKLKTMKQIIDSTIFISSNLKIL